MLNIFSNKKNLKSIENKKILNKELFNSSNQKQTITRAARESAEDQRKLLSDYNRIIDSKSHCIS